jgi:DNA mismatch repair ATPase MutS
MEGMYYLPHINEKPVLNDIDLSQNIMITGPNAAGKTTILKSLLINLLMSQQFGYGCYKKAQVKVYDIFHSYLNIPDTSGRDSLFQAEARRCKEILDIVHDNSRKQTHFCVFDELYSGTNPDEAVLSAHAFMKYLIKFKNVNCILTTHFIELCKKLDTNDSIENYHMSTNKSGNDFNYSYLLKKGISNIKGGVKVLFDMNYPKEIIDNTINLN